MRGRGILLAAASHKDTPVDEITPAENVTEIGEGRR
jgi:hypothetical protein